MSMQCLQATASRWSCSVFTKRRPVSHAEVLPALPAEAQRDSTPSPTRRDVTFGVLLAGVMLTAAPTQAVEQGILPSDYTLAAKSSAEYRDKIREVRQKAFSAMEGLIEDSKYTELSNSLVLGPIDDIRQSVLYIPSALLKEGKRQEAIGSRKAYTDYLRELKKLDALAQKAGRFEADEEDVKDSIGRLSLRLDDVLKYVP